MAFRATRKVMLWYLEQQVNSCYCIQSNKEINAKGNQSNKEIHAQVSGTNILETWNLSQISQPNLKKQNATLINPLIGSIFWNKNILCPRTFQECNSLLCGEGFCPVGKTFTVWVFCQEKAQDHTCYIVHCSRALYFCTDVIINFFKFLENFRVKKC